MIVVSFPGLDGSSFPYSSFAAFSITHCLCFSPMLIFSLLRSSRGQRASAKESRTKQRLISETCLPPISLSIPHCHSTSPLPGIRAHHRPQLARPLMSLTLSLLLIPLFRGAYIPTQPIDFSIVLPHIRFFTVNVVFSFKFWSKRSRSFTILY